LGTNTNISWNSARKEIQKCILVCANCHREIHAGLIDLDSLKSSFSEDRANEID
jgi:predicted HNH restriction endonuclease